MGCGLLTPLGFAAAGFWPGDFFGEEGFAAFVGLAELLERCASFLSGLDGDFVFRVGMGGASLQNYQRSDLIPRALGLNAGVCLTTGVRIRPG
jgi:hypothetical protein